MARYDHLIARFDDRKEQLYHDVRRIYESYPPRKADDAWYVAGQAMLRALDLDKVPAFRRAGLPGRPRKQPARRSPGGGRMPQAHQGGVQEYAGPRTARPQQGNCPYTYYEDIAENSIRPGPHDGRKDAPARTPTSRTTTSTTTSWSTTTTGTPNWPSPGS
jgi:hypothetical protein